MPDINDPIRSQVGPQRADALLTAAQAEITNRWSGRSWSEVLNSVWANRNWAAGQGLKVAVNMTVGRWVAPLAEAGLDKVGAAYVKESLKQMYALVEDQIKSAAEEAVKAAPSKAVTGIQAIKAKVQGTQPAQAELNIVECVTELKAKFVELGLRAKNVKAAANNGSFRYCDDVHFAVRELAHAEACRHTVIANCDQAIAYLQGVRNLAESTIPDPVATLDAFRQAAVRVVEDEQTIKHKNHQNFGVLGSIRNPLHAMNVIGHSCSKEHCFGKV